MRADAIHHSSEAQLSSLGQLTWSKLACAVVGQVAFALQAAQISTAIIAVAARCRIMHTILVSAAVQFVDHTDSAAAGAPPL